MRTRHKRRLLAVAFLVIGLGTGVALILMALNENINLFFTPTQVLAGEPAPEGRFRIGGMVLPGSVEKVADDIRVKFILSDFSAEVPLEYSGILPDLFREGQGIVAEGGLDERGVFIADQVLARHDENYMPPEVEQALRAGLANQPDNSGSTE